MTVRDLDNFFAQLMPEKRVPGGRDGLKWGCPDAEIKAVATTWMATADVIRRAAGLGCNVIVTHEPTFYWDDVGSEKPEWEIAAEHRTPTDAKQKLMADLGIEAVLRVHDAWDFYPEFGITDSLARALNFRNKVSEADQVPMWQLRPVPLGEVARHAKTRLRLRLIRVLGDLSQEVQKPALAVGAFGGLEVILRAMDQGADCLIGGECSEWQVARFCEDAGFGLILLGHAESETPGMTAMADFLREKLGLEAHPVPTAQTFVTL
ncbi:MAG: Nif3-like dinuclear metal center hexameric protein [Armatimonadetes bacterium]|nr:Nif3-like dinuclear metal center hexameric protein [Armatimonadota bacterium]